MAKKKLRFLFAIPLVCTTFAPETKKQMDSKNLVLQFTDNLFWDTDVSKLDLNEYPDYVIQRVLEYGEMKDWRLLNRFYGLPKIVEVCKGLRTLDPVCLSFICAISHTPKEDYRCYRTKQSDPTLWNS